MSRNEDILRAMIDGTAYTNEPQSRNEELLLELKAVIETGGLDPDNYYTKQQTDSKITEKVAEIVADAPEDFDTLKEMSDWISQHEESAAAMNTAIRANATAITGKVDKETGKGLSTEDFTTSEKTKLAGIETGANKITVDSTLSSSSTNPVQNKAVGNAIASKVSKNGCTTLTGSFTPSSNNTAQLGSNSYRFSEIYATNIYSNVLYLSTPLSASQGGTGCTSLNAFKTALNLGTAAEKSYTTSVTSESLDLITSGAVYTGLADKVDKVTGKGLSTEDYTTAEKTKLAGIEAGAEANIQSDWGQSDSTADDFIKNKPTLGSAASRSVVLSLSNAGSGLPTSGTVYSALETKVDKVTGKGLSTEDFTTAEKNSLSVLSEFSTATVTIDLNSQTWTQSANGLFYTGNISVTNLYKVFSTIITGFSALKATDNVAVIANSDNTAIRLTASTNTFSNQANITVSVFGRFTSS